MGVSLVGKKHQREADTSQGPDRELEAYPTESVAQAAADALRLTVNNPSNRRNLRQTNVNTLWEHYCAKNCHERSYPRKTHTSCMPRTGSSLDGETCCWKSS